MYDDTEDVSTLTRPIVDKSVKKPGAIELALQEQGDVLSHLSDMVHKLTVKLGPVLGPEQLQESRDKVPASEPHNVSSAIFKNNDRIREAMNNLAAVAERLEV